MEPGIVFAISLLTVTAGTEAQARFPLSGTLLQEQDLIVVCGVDPERLAKECGPGPGISLAEIGERNRAFLKVEAASPDYLAGATPGSKVQVIIRRSGSKFSAGAGRASPPSAPLEAVTAPEWTIMPAPRDVDGYLPERAIRLSTSGEAAVRCTVSTLGDLIGCWVIKDTQPEMAFGTALLRISTLVQMKATTTDGSSIAGSPYTLIADFDAKTGRITLSNGL